MATFGHLTKHQAQAFIVDEFGPAAVSALDYLQHTSDRDSTEIQL